MSTKKVESWDIRFRLPARAPVVLVDETFDLEAEDVFTLDFERNFTPDHLFYRSGKEGPLGPVGTLATWKIEPDAEPVFVLAPWLPWWEREREGNWFGLYAEQGHDLLAVAAINPGIWVEPNANVKASHQFALRGRPGTLTLDLPLRRGRRRWMIEALKKDEALSALTSRQAKHDKSLQWAPLPQQYLIRYGDFPLDRVKDEMAFPREAVPVEHPRLLVTKAQVAAFRATFKPDPTTLAQTPARAGVEVRPGWPTVVLPGHG